MYSKNRLHVYALRTNSTFNLNTLAVLALHNVGLMCVPATVNVYALYEFMQTLGKCEPAAPSRLVKITLKNTQMCPKKSVNLIV